MALAVGCADAEQTAAEDLEQLKRWVVKNYGAVVHASYADSAEAAEELRAALGALADEPGAGTLEAAKQAWVAARKPYLQTEAYRFYDGPIDGEGGPEGLINAWPMDEAYVDSVKGAPEAGIINRPEDYPEITAELVAELNEQGGETNIASGFHAIEFLLWGQDFNADGPGRRPVSAFTEAPNAGRRLDYLRACADLLVSNLESLAEAWAPGREGNYRAGFEADGGQDAALANIVGGIKNLAGFELAGERLLVAYDSQSQEDEHSCFSDTTHLDALYDAVGIENVYLGRYERTGGTVVEGPSLQDLAETVDPGLKSELDTAVTRAVEACRAIPAPFDQAVLGDDDAPGRKKIMAAIGALEDLDALLGKLAGKLDYELPAGGDEGG